MKWLLTKVWLKEQIFYVSKHSLSILLYPALYSRNLICIDCLKEQSCLALWFLIGLHQWEALPGDWGEGEQFQRIDPYSPSL